NFHSSNPSSTCASHRAPLLTNHSLTTACLSRTEHVHLHSSRTHACTPTALRAWAGRTSRSLQVRWN
ncbi:hypothetical protein BGX20_003731, partial [Mortierella sp. AD010]